MSGRPKWFSRPALQCLLGDSDLGVPWRWNLAGESPGIYFEPLLGGDISSDLLAAITGGLVRNNSDSSERRPVLALPCTLNELLAFEDAAGVFRDRLEAGDETEQLLRRIAADNPEAGELARVLLKAPGTKATTAKRSARQGTGAPTFCWVCNRQLRRAPGRGKGLFYFELVRDPTGAEHRVHGRQCLRTAIEDGNRLVKDMRAES